MSPTTHDLTRALKAGELLELAALSSGGLRTAFEQVAGLLDGEMFQLFNFTRPDQPDMIVSPDRQAIYEDYINKGWHQHDIWSHRAAQVARHGLVLTEHSVLTADQRRSDAFFQEFCPKWNIGNFTAWTFDLAGEKWAYTLMGRGGAMTTRPDKAIYRRFMQAADRAALLATATESHYARGMAEGFELGGRPTLVMDHSGNISFITRSAEALIGQGFSIRHGRLESQQAGVDYAFRQLALHAGSARRRHLHNFLIQRGHGLRPIVVMPVHVRDRGMDGLPGARIIVMLVDLEASHAPQTALLQSAFGLTKRESELAARVGGGATPDEAGRTMGISINTVRQMLKVLYAKTNTRRQSELSALVERMPG
ncbi:MAG: helix-turn-helix transcriptional regulator [Alphaproteobacteria bacterium]|nr:helix-turn-helix transcriptional regulator [Alphaproteobacteria bacterium]